MIQWLFDTYLVPSKRKLALVPLAFAFGFVFWHCCKLAEGVAIAGVAEPSDSPTYWTFYSLISIGTLVDTIGNASRKDPDWYWVPAKRAIGQLFYYPPSIFIARLFLPLVSCGFVDSTAAIWVGPYCARWFRYGLGPAATFNPASFLRGIRRLSKKEQDAALSKLSSDGVSAILASGLAQQTAPGMIRWMGLQLPEWISQSHFMVIGGTGSGKTLAICDLMCSVLPRVEPASDLRAVVFDAKGDMLSRMDQMGVKSESVLIFNPFDARSVAWDIAADVTEPKSAETVASQLIPDRPNDSQPFFANSARELIKEVIIELIRSLPGRWTLLDLYYITASPQRLHAFLRRTSRGRDFLERVNKPPKTFRNFLQEIATALGPITTVASLWEHAHSRISLSKWANSQESILLLDGRDTNRASLMPINRLMLQFISAHVLGGNETNRARFWLFLDEAQEAGKLECVTDLLNKGRSKGIRIVLGYQDIEGLHAAYGRDRGEKIAGMAWNVSFLKVTSPNTAEWCCKRIGELEEMTLRRSWSTVTSTSEQLHRAHAVIPSELLHLEPPSGSGATRIVRGFHILTGVVGILDVSAEYPIFTANPALDFMPRPKHQQNLPDWTDAMAVRLSMSQLEANTPDNKSQRKEEKEEPPTKPKKPKPRPEKPEDFDSLGDFEAPI